MIVPPSRSIAFLFLTALLNRADQESHVTRLAAVPADDEMLPRLLVKMADTYSRSAAFRGCFDNKRLEGLIPAIADFLSITGNPSHYTERVAQSRQRLSRLMEMWHENDRLANMLRTQASLAPKMLIQRY